MKYIVSLCIMLSALLTNAQTTGADESPNFFELFDLEEIDRYDLKHPQAKGNLHRRIILHHLHPSIYYFPPTTE